VDHRLCIGRALLQHRAARGIEERDGMWAGREGEGEVRDAGVREYGECVLSREFSDADSANEREVIHFYEAPCHGRSEVDAGYDLDVGRVRNFGTDVRERHSECLPSAKVAGDFQRAECDGSSAVRPAVPFAQRYLYLCGIVRLYSILPLAGEHGRALRVWEARVGIRNTRRDPALNGGSQWHSDGGYHRMIRSHSAR